MGMSANGYLFWGISLGDQESMENPLEWLEDGGPDPEDLIAESFGLVNPDPGDQDWKSWYAIPENKAAQQVYWTGKDNAVKFTGEVKYTGHYDFPGIALIIPESEQSCAWSEHTPVDFTTQPDWQPRLDRLCVILDAPSAPGKWLLACSYE